jgi:hypothetical protein
VLFLKLFLVPACLLAISLAGRRWGPGVAGWLAGMPVVVGPILLFLALDHGVAFTARAANASLSACSTLVTPAIWAAAAAAAAALAPATSTCTSPPHCSAAVTVLRVAALMDALSCSAITRAVI